MPGERTPDSSARGTTGSSDDDISLREHIQRQLDVLERGSRDRLDALRDLLDQRFIAQEKAVEELKTTTQQRFEAVNEFRAQLGDQARTFMGRDESISRHERTQEALNEMATRHDSEVRLLRDRHEADMATVNSRLDLGQGRSTGLDKAWGYIIGAIGLAGTVIAIIIATR